MTIIGLQYMWDLSSQNGGFDRFFEHVRGESGDNYIMSGTFALLANHLLFGRYLSHDMGKKHGKTNYS